MNTEDRATICSLSTAVARDLLRDADPEHLRYCDIIVEECCSDSPPPSLATTGKRHGFSGIETFLLADLPAAIICGVIVEVIKYYVTDLLPRSRHKTRTDCITVLARMFDEQARREGLPDDQAADLARRFSAFLSANPQILSKHP